MADGRLPVVLATLIAAAATLAGGAALVGGLGLYSVAASEGHWRITERILTFGLHRSVAFHAPDIDPPDLTDPDRIRLGAAHYHGGCAFCHSAPGQPASPVVQRMLPPPPDLGDAVDDWSDRELFFIVRHGLKYAGMPGWPAINREDEIWSMVAFLRALPELDAEGYESLALGNAEGRSISAQEIVAGETWSAELAACARCHEGLGAGPADALTPRLAGQSADYLQAAMTAYARGERASGIMQPVAVELEPEQIEAIAGYYSDMARPAGPAPEPADPETLARGEGIARRGVPERDAPACLSCHGEDREPDVPVLEGQSELFLANQLRMFKRGARGGPEHHTLMTDVAGRLTEDQIADAAAWFAARGGP